MYRANSENGAVTAAWRSENLFVDQWINQHRGWDREHDRRTGDTEDNRSELFASFRLVLDRTHTRYAAGYQWFCKVCGMPCASVEVWFPCRERFVTIKVMCHLGCHNRWRLNLARATTNKIPDDTDKRLVC